ncbi:MAG: DUF721 domain-containing protein [Kofleriaceae bacterium]|nr:DUF721 domain-containing protein [Kofleriaceae bacterium]
MAYRSSKKRFRLRNQKLGADKAQGALSSVLNRYGIAKEIREHRLLIHWDKVVGTRVAAHTTPDALDKGMLWVRVDNSSWMHQLSFLTAEIITKANELCGEEIVKSLRFHLGRGTSMKTDALSAAARIRRPLAKERPLPMPAVGFRLDSIIDEASGIEDAELRDAIVDIRRRLNM